jgi:hypothetical protein
MSPPEYLKSPISTTLVAVIASFESLATCIVACRFYLRLKLKQGVKWDDYLALLSLVRRLIRPGRIRLTLTLDGILGICHRYIGCSKGDWG